ncbi:MAG: hypothetical protein U0X20_23680 [Caldilineaceae bacterium]
MNRYSQGANLVAPTPTASKPQLPVVVQQVLAPTGEPMALDAVWEPQRGAAERYTAMDRARALRVRLTPFVWTWGGVGLAVGGAVWFVGGAVPLAALSTVLIFACLTALTYLRFNRTDYEFSREGTERRRIDVAANLAQQRMFHEHELRRMALEAYLQTLDKASRE